jgi:hypothetical protein
MDSKTGTFEIATVDKGLFRKGLTAPSHLFAHLTTTPVVESWHPEGDWIVIGLSGGYTFSLPESRIDYILTSDKH